MAEIFGESRGTPSFDQSTTFFQPVWRRDPATNAFRFTRLETGPGNEGSVCTPSGGGIRTERNNQSVDKVQQCVMEIKFVDEQQHVKIE